MDNRRFIALGDIIADFFYNKTKLLGVDGGSSRFNVIANLAHANCKCAIKGGCGNDTYGKAIIERLSKTGVDTSGLFYRNRPVRGYHLTINQETLPQVTYKCSRISPINGESTWYEDNLEDISCFSNGINEETDVIILDSLDEFALEIINKLKCDKVLDIGSIGQLNKLKNEQVNILRGNIEVLQLNEVVLPCLRDRFKITNPLDVYDFFQPKFMTVTYGKEGADFVFNNKVYNKKLINSAKEVDPTGAGDAFLSVVVRKYYDNSKIIDEKFIDSTFEEATALTSRVVQNVGARGHIYEKIIEKTVKNRRIEGIEK